MSSKKRPRRRNAPIRRSAPAAERSGNPLGMPVLIIAAVAVAVFGGWYVLAGGGGDGSASAEDSGPVRVIDGSRHTVFHSNLPLPTGSVPQAEGKPTLVWFSGTWCEFCEAMEPFANSTAAEFDARMVFVEKSVDHAESDSQKFRVRGTPTFVMLDVNGSEIARFGFQRTAGAFRATIEDALALAGSS